MKNIGLSKLSSDSTLYRKVAERRGILSFFTREAVLDNNETNGSLDDLSNM
jgi:hypothetical protein